MNYRLTEVSVSDMGLTCLFCKHWLIYLFKQSNYHELETFEFLISLVIWYDLLFAVNKIGLMQNKNMQLDVALGHLKGLISFLQQYRENGFTSAIATACMRAIADELDVPPI